MDWNRVIEDLNARTEMAMKKAENRAQYNEQDRRMAATIGGICGALARALEAGIQPEPSVRDAA